MVEHDPLAVAMADDVVEIGPGGGDAGGRLVFQGPPADAVAGRHGVGRGFSGRARAGTRRAARCPTTGSASRAPACATSATSTARSRSGR